MIVITIVIGIGTWWFTSGIQALEIFILSVLLCVGIFLLLVVDSDPLDFNFPEIFLGLYIAVIGGFIATGPLQGVYTGIRSQLGFGVLDPPKVEKDFVISGNNLTPSDTISEGMILAFKEEGKWPVFVTGRITLPPEGGEVHLQELSTGRTSPAVMVVPEVMKPPKT